MSGPLRQSSLTLHSQVAICYSPARMPHPRAPSALYRIAAHWQRLRLATRLAAVLSVVSALMFGIYGLRVLHTEEQDLLRGSERDARLLARALQVAANQALRTANLADTRELLVRLQTIEPQLRVVVRDRGGLTLLHTAAEPPADLVQRLGRDVDQRWREQRPPPEDRVLHYEPPDDPQLLLIALPVVDASGQLAGHLVVQQSLRDLRDDLQDTRRALGWGVGLFTLVTWAVALLLGDLAIGRPMRALIAAMRSVRRGDLKTAAEFSGSPEVSVVAEEFNAMVRDLRQARGELEAAAEARRIDQRALQQADKLVTIGQLSAGLAHEIGSPLQVLGGRARSLQQRGEDPAEVRRVAGIIVDQVERITRVVEQLLHYTRRRPARTAMHDLGGVVQPIVSLLEGEARRNGVTLSLHAAPDLPEVACDADQMQQMFLNLLTNALIATEAGGEVAVTLALATGESVPSLRCTVRDNGCGMPPEVLARLFEPFFTTRAATGGSGLGLAVVRAIVHEHRGSIDVRSAPGTGTTVTVNLPIAATAVARRATTQGEA